MELKKAKYVSYRADPKNTLNRPVHVVQNNETLCGIRPRAGYSFVERSNDDVITCDDCRAAHRRLMKEASSDIKIRKAPKPSEATA